MDLDDILAGVDAAKADSLSDGLDDLLSPESPDDLLGDAADPRGPNAEDSTAAEAAVIDIPKLRLAPLQGPLPVRQNPVKLTPFRDAPPYVRPYMTNACFYANQVSVINSADTRVRRGLVVNDSNIYIMNDGAQVERTVPLPHVEALVTQNNVMVKSLGISKEWQTHVLLVLREGPDLFFALSEDKRKDPATGGCMGDKIPPLDAVLSELLQAYNLDLPVCVLNDREAIRDLVTWSVSDIRMRCECFQILAYRASLTAQLKELIQRDAHLIVSRNQLESSGASKSSAALLEEVALIETKNDAVSGALRSAEESLRRSRAKKAELRGALRAEEQRLDALVRERVDLQNARDIAAEAREYALMRAVHAGELRRLGAVAAFLRARAAGRGGAAAEAQRRGLRAAAERRRAAATEALAEGKQRLAAAKRAAAEAAEAAATRRALPPGAPLPADWDPALAPVFLPVHMPEVAAGEERRESPVPQGGAVVLDDDEEEELVLPNPKQKAAGGPKLGVVLDDDDL